MAWSTPNLAPNGAVERYSNSYPDTLSPHIQLAHALNEPTIQKHAIVPRFHVFDFQAERRCDCRMLSNRSFALHMISCRSKNQVTARVLMGTKRWRCVTQMFEMKSQHARCNPEKDDGWFETTLVTLQRPPGMYLTSPLSSSMTPKVARVRESTPPPSMKPLQNIRNDVILDKISSILELSPSFQMPQTQKRERG